MMTPYADGDWPSSRVRLRMNRIRRCALGPSLEDPRVRLGALLALLLVGACDCGGMPPDISPIDGGATLCVVNSDCGDGAYCGEGGFCIEGLPPGTCETDEDCDGEEVCIFPDGSDIGACLNPHACDTDDDCQEGQICEDGDGDGYRDCLFSGCEDDAECVEEIGADCSINEEAKCIARACVCRDLCGADCGEGSQCCALPGTTAICIDDPGPCAMLECEPGYAGATDSYGDWESPTCDYADAQCACEELPPLPPGTVGTPHELATDGDGRVWAVAYNETYGDVVVVQVSTTSPLSGWRHVDGVPPVSDDAPIVAGPSGPRGGVEEPGPDVGRWLDASFTSNNIRHIVARDDTHGVLRHIYGPPEGPFLTRDLDTDGDAGFAPRILFDAQDRPVVSHVVRNNGAGRSVLRVMSASAADASPAQWTTYSVDDFPLSQVACQGGCADGFVCPEPANPNAVPACVPEVEDCGACDGICTSSGCEVAATAAPFKQSLIYDSLDLARSGGDFMVFGHDPRDGELIGHRTTSGSLFTGTATFGTSTLLSQADEDLGGRPAAARGGAGFYVASTDTTGRRLTLLETSATLTVVGELDIDDGERPHPSGATGHHAVDNAAIGLDDGGEGVIAWQDGTTGAVWGRWLLAGGALGAPQILGGAGAGSSYEGFYGFSVDVAAAPSGPVVTAQRVWLGMDPQVSELVRLPAPARCPDDDAFEDNDDQASASPIDPSEAVTGMICPDDDDFYELSVPGACSVMAELVFRDAAGDLDLRLLDSTGATVDSSASVTDYETVDADVSAGTYTLRVYGFNGAENGYALRVEVDCP